MSGLCHQDKLLAVVVSPYLVFRMNSITWAGQTTQPTRLEIARLGDKSQH
jgi:hypothetical protein